MHILTTDSFHLRQFQLRDLAFLTELMTDQLIMQFTGFRSIQSSEQISTHLKKYTTEDQIPFGVWAAIDTKTDEGIGWFMLKKTEAPFPELGFMTRRKFWNRGMTTQISQEILKYGLTQQNCHKIVARTDTQNIASQSVLLKIGMQEIKSDGSTLYYECSAV